QELHSAAPGSKKQGHEPLIYLPSKSDYYRDPSLHGSLVPFQSTPLGKQGDTMFLPGIWTAFPAGFARLLVGAMMVVMMAGTATALDNSKLPKGTYVCPRTTPECGAWTSKGEM